MLEYLIYDSSISLSYITRELNGRSFNSDKRENTNITANILTFVCQKVSIEPHILGFGFSEVN